ncbi:MAG: hypothetical protein KC591_01950, partial [Gemmatimonadetes bacterium]|nr:hypothetical protein [Gemmatimonadota bacterium]
MIRRLRSAILFLGLAILLASPGLSLAADTADTSARITYVTPSTIYVDAGTDAGVRLGDVVKVFRDGVFLTALEVTAVSSKRTSCTRTDDVELKVGDVVTFRSIPDPKPAPRTENRRRGGPKRDDGWLRRHGVRGRLGLRVIGLVDDSEFGRGYTEPAVDARLDSDLHPDVHLTVDARARRTYLPGEDRSRSRVYRLQAAWQPDSAAVRAVVGRQFSGSLSTINVFDGVLAEYRRPRWGAGAFYGTQPDPISYGLSSHIREHGAYFELLEDPAGGIRWRLTASAIGSYHDSVIDREYLALQARWTGPRLFVSALQEFDLNRGWKAKAGEPAVTLTSLFASARYRFTERWSADLGVDTRRSVRLFRDLETPETTFDDEYRQGVWTGVTFRPASRSRLGLSGRRSTGGSAGTAESVTALASAGMRRLGNLDGRIRSTLYRNDDLEGRLASLSASSNVTARLRLGATYGQRHEHRIAADTDKDLNWKSVDLDYVISRSWILISSVEITNGDTERDTQYHASAIWR